LRFPRHICVDKQHPDCTAFFCIGFSIPAEEKIAIDPTLSATRAQLLDESEQSL